MCIYTYIDIYIGEVCVCMGDKPLRVPSQARLSRLWKGYKRNTEIGHTNTDDTHKYIRRTGKQ